MNRRKKSRPRAKKKHIDGWYIKQYYDLGWHREVAWMHIRLEEKRKAWEREVLREGARGTGGELK